MIRTVYLIRHGITEGNQRNWYYGHTDVPLAGEGVRGVQALIAEGVYPTPENAVYYSSGLARADQTLSLIYGEVPRIRLDGLKEIYFGTYEAKTHEELKDDPAYMSWIHDESGLDAPHGGESSKQFSQRVRSGFARVLGDGNEQSVVVCHGGVICVIMDSLFDDHKGNRFKWIPLPGRGYAIAFEGSRPLAHKPI